MGDFFGMGGYGPYVWVAYGVFALVIIGEILVIRRRNRDAISQLQQRQAERRAEASPRNMST